ncbi:transposase [Enorma phocaeensis]|uniref:transposase n=1 Tax=Enorma phocaeensis TaxID=1871019 RepID=UPI003209FC72
MQQLQDPLDARLHEPRRVQEGGADPVETVQISVANPGSARGFLRSIELGVSNARVEAVNNKIKVAIRQGYGFRNIDNLIALVMLRFSDLKPSLPGRAAG